ncbi:hypothetical protein ABPG72_000888 [Tetrahymena utriculariae]
MIEDYFSFPSTASQPQHFIDLTFNSQLKQSQLLRNRCKVNQANLCLEQIIESPVNISYNRLNNLNRSKKNRSNCLIQQNFNQFLDKLQTEQNGLEDTLFHYQDELNTNNELKDQNDQIFEDSDIDNEEEEYSIWDNSQLQDQGFDCKNFQNKEGKEFTFYQLYRMRQCQLLEYVPIQKTIENFSTIYKIYLEPTEKCNLHEQQQYLELNYMIQKQSEHKNQQKYFAQKEFEKKYIKYLERSFQKENSEIQKNVKLKKTLNKIILNSNINSLSQKLQIKQLSQHVYPKSIHNRHASFYIKNNNSKQLALDLNFYSQDLSSPKKIIQISNFYKDKKQYEQFI